MVKSVVTAERKKISGGLGSNSKVEVGEKLFCPESIYKFWRKIKHCYAVLTKNQQ